MYDVSRVVEHMGMGMGNVYSIIVMYLASFCSIHHPIIFSLLPAITPVAGRWALTCYSWRDPHP